MQTFRENVQMVFQDPYSSLNPRLSVFDLIAEPLTNIEEYRKDKKKLDARVREMMDVVGLSRRLINAYPHELDGGPQTTCWYCTGIVCQAGVYRS